MTGTPTRDRRGERHAATRHEILDVAWQICRHQGLAALSLRDVADAMGMRAPSLYSYFPSKHAIYDAMFADAAREFLASQAAPAATGDALAGLKASLRGFVEFCTEDPSRYQLLFQRTIPGFEPSADSFAIAVAALDATRDRLASYGINEPRALDLATAIGTGLADQQISNDPDGDRWLRLVDEAVEMFYAHHTRRQRRSRAR